MNGNMILLIDDDPVFSQFTRELLVTRGLEVVTASSKSEGMEVFEKHNPSCVVLDILLPDGSGVDLIKPLRAVWAAIPIVIDFREREKWRRSCAP